MNFYSVRELEEQKGALCERLLRALPRWFGIEQSIVSYVREVEDMAVLAALAGVNSIGFLALHPHNDYTAEIHVMAVDPAYHRQGVGKLLVRERPKPGL